MSHLKITTTRSQRILSIFIVGLLFLFLQGVEGVQISSFPIAHGSSFFWVFYGCYAFISLLFYGVGSLCWLYAYKKQQVVATLLFLFTSFMMVAFSSLSASAIGMGVFATLSNDSSAFAVLFFFLLLLRFPSPVFPSLKGPSKVLFRLMVAVLTVLCVFTAFRNTCFYLLGDSVPHWWTLVGFLYYLLTSIAVVIVVVYATRRVKTVREHQQARFFLLGTLLSFVPILGLTVLPSLFHSRFAVDGRFSMLFLVLYPVTAAFGVLRYNTLLFDEYIRKVVVAVVGVIGWALLTFVLFTIGSIVVSASISVYLALLLLAGVLGGPCVWWFGRLVTEHVFFPEMHYYQRVLKQSKQYQAEHSFDLQEVAHLLVIDVMRTLNAPVACVFVLDEEAHTYALLEPPAAEQERSVRQRTHLLSQIKPCLSLSQLGSSQIQETVPLVSHLHAAKRPLFWEEIMQACSSTEGTGVASRISIVMRREGSLGPLLAPLRSPQGVLIGVLVVGERGDDVRYSGPDIEALVQIVQLSSMPMETARQFGITTRQQQRTAIEREEAYQQQRRLNDMKDQLIMHMSHELRTPLSEVTGFLELLQESGEELDAALRTKFIERAIHGSVELEHLLTSIIEASQVTVPQETPPLEDVSLLSVLQEEVEHLQPHLMQFREVRLESTQEVHVHACTQKVRQVIRNLLSNALKYSPDHTTVRVQVTAAGGKGTVSVKDEGAGITAQEMQLLFSKFSRLPQHQAGSIRGTGLGLFISRQMTEAMKGPLWV